MVVVLPALATAMSPSISGAWRSTDGHLDRVLLVVDGFWTYTIFDRSNPEFHRTFGGPYRADGETVKGAYHFDSGDATQVGQTFSLRVRQQNDTLELLHDDGTSESWRRIPEQSGPLTGVWRIIGRQSDDSAQLAALRPRRTLKVLTGSRFQWIAMNIETGEFSGTGGGTYTFADGKYVENLEFFSRDNSRVGARLEFDGTVNDGRWRHQGLSSRGDPIDETWVKLGPEEGRVRLGGTR